MSNVVQNHLVDIELLVRQYDMNELSRRLTDLGTINRMATKVGEKGSQKPCWLREQLLPKARLKSQHAKDMLDGTRKDKK